MSRKTRDLLTKGLTSELYLLAYIEPNNIRKLGQKLQNTSGHPTNYSKVSPAIHNLTIAKYLKSKQDDDKFYVNIEKLAFELENILNEKNIFLKDIEKKYFFKLLEENEFFKLIIKDIIEKIQTQEKGKHEINALEVFCERIGAMCATTLLHKTMDTKDRFAELEESDLSFEEKIEKLDEFKEEWKEISKKMDEGFEKLSKEFSELPPIFIEMMTSLFKNLPSMTICFLIPQETLKKLGSLWTGYEGIQAALQVYDFNKKS